MKVFQINVVYNTGSTGRIAAQLKEAVEERGGECMVAYGRGFHMDTGTYKIGSKADMYAHVLLTRMTDKHGFFSKRNTKRLIEKIREFEPDLIHLHNLHGYYLNVEMLFAFLKEYGKPVVWTLHDCWTFTGHCSHYMAVGCQQWKTHCIKCNEKGRYPGSWAKDNCKSNFDRKKKAFTGLEKMVIVTPSKWLAKQVKESFLREYEVQVIQNGIDIDAFAPTTGTVREKIGVTEKKVVLGVANVWNDRKGLEDFVQISQKLGNQYAVVLVGLSDKQLREIPDTIVGIKRTESVQELAELYSAAHVFVNLTYEDTFPSVNLEALACGTPVITYDTGGSPEAIDEKTGICLEPGDIDGVVKAIKSIDRIQREDCLARGRNFDKNSRFEEYLNLYERKL